MGFLMTTAERKILRANPRACEMIGYSEAELVGIEFPILPDHLDGFEANDALQEIADGKVNYGEFPVLRKNGEVIWCYLYGMPIQAQEQAREIIWILHDITERVLIEHKLVDKELHIHYLSQIYAALSRTHHTIVHSPSEAELFEQVCRIAVETGGMKFSWIGRLNQDTNAVDVVAYYGQGSDYLDGLMLSADPNLVEGRGPTGIALRAGKPVIVQEFDRDDSTRPWWERARLFGFLSFATFPIRRNGKPYAILAVYHAGKHVFDENMVGLLENMSDDISYALDLFSHAEARKAAEEQIQHMAHYDPLTGLPNRTLLTDRANQAFRRAVQTGESVALLFIDLDHFKYVNETLGHQVGDELLIEITKRLRNELRVQDTISRPGGDEFIVLLPSTTANGAVHVAENLLKLIPQPFTVGDYELVVTPSIGIAIYPADGDNLSTLSKCADIAMYRSKQSGRNTYQFFAPEMQRRSNRYILLENALRHALARNELYLQYQPQVSLGTGEIVGVEALLRWHHSKLGMISPGEFIPIAEESGMILPIGEWVLRTAVRQMKSWIDEGLRPIVVAVNLSAIQFKRGSIPQLVEQVLRDEGLAPEWLELELTESVAMSDPEKAISIMDELHRLGVRISIDDFGTGYSSLAYLKRFQIDKLKIDQSFVRDLVTDSDNEAIVDAVISLAKSMNLRTIAEGVEDDLQLRMLRNKDCEEMQGFYFSKPLNADDFREWANRRLPTIATG